MIGGWALSCSDQDLCKLKPTQHSARLILVLQLKSVGLVIWRILRTYVFGSHISTRLGRIFKGGLFSNKHCCALGLCARRLELRRQARQAYHWLRML